MILISIVGFKNAEDIRACLIALAAQTDQEFSVLICENGGADAFDALVQSLDGLASATASTPLPPPRTRRVWQGRLGRYAAELTIFESIGNYGFAAGVNHAIEKMLEGSRYTALWMLNPDAAPHQGALAALRARAAETGAMLVSSRIVFNDTLRVQLYGGRWRRIIGRGLNIGLNAPGDAPVDASIVEKAMDYVNGASLFASREFVVATGMMDESYFLYVEEVEWCMRRPHVKIAYAHDALVYHKHGGAIGSNKDWKKRSPLSVYLEERNRLLFTRRRFPCIYPLTTILSLLLQIRYLRHGVSTNNRVALQGWVAGLRGKFGAPQLTE